MDQTDKSSASERALVDEATHEPVVTTHVSVRQRRPSCYGCKSEWCWIYCKFLVDILCNIYRVKSKHHRDSLTLCLQAQPHHLPCLFSVLDDYRYGRTCNPQSHIEAKHRTTKEQYYPRSSQWRPNGPQAILAILAKNWTSEALRQAPLVIYNPSIAPSSIVPRPQRSPRLGHVVVASRTSHHLALDLHPPGHVVASRLLTWPTLATLSSCPAPQHTPTLATFHVVIVVSCPSTYTDLGHRRRDVLIAPPGINLHRPRRPSVLLLNID
ncbi:hypothetical protein D9611_013230 [Ephemerocybe angulata]|uniref:Uncharacterized protein n=1 Tax=Ephemerocybe angulata TaxID=980116 RepID=A0A8H5BTC3_9AGAR|nr:hypothetical protein D9611_013230 [Tulosesus angulatus]